MNEAEWLASDDPLAMLRFVAPKGSVSRAMLDRGPVSDRKLRLFACAKYRALFAANNAERACALGQVEKWVDEGGEPPERSWHLYGDALVAAYHLLNDPVSRPHLPTLAALARDVFGSPHRRPTRLCECDRCHGHGLVDPRTGLGADEGHECGHCRGAGMMVPDWLTPQVLSIARAAYDERLGKRCETCKGNGWLYFGRPCPGCGVFEGGVLKVGTGRSHDGTLDPALLSVLADALEDDGCEDEPLLRHLRGWERCRPCLGRLRDGRGEPVGGTCPACFDSGWVRSPNPHVRGCWVLDLVLGKE